MRLNIYRGGVGEGNCAAGFGVCCVFSSTCNEETSQNTTYFSSPSTIPAGKGKTELSLCHKLKFFNGVDF